MKIARIITSLGLGFILTISFTLAHADEPVVVINRPGFAARVSFDRESMWTVIMAELESESGMVLVDRATFLERLDELAMSEMELTRANGAVRLGSLLGAQYFVNTRCANVNENTLATVQVVDVATSRTYSAYRMVEGQDLPDVAVAIAALTRETLARVSPADVPGRAAQRSTPELPSPADAPRPRVAVHIEEEHVTPPALVAAAIIIDPAAEIEITKRLIEAEFPVVDLAFSAALKREEGEPMAIAAGLAREKDLDYLIYGEAISELGDRVGAFRGVRARVEVKVVDVRSGRVVFSDSAYAGATDLAESIAGKKALQIAANEVADKLLPRLLERHARAR